MIPLSNTGDTRELKLQLESAKRMAVAARRAGQDAAAYDWDLLAIGLYVTLERQLELRCSQLAEAA